MRHLAKKVCVLLSAFVLFCASMASGDDDLAQPASWQVPQVDDVRTQMMTWLEQQKVDQAIMDQAGQLWSPQALAEGQLDLLQRVGQTIALVEPRAAEVGKICATGANPAKLADLKWLDADETNPMIRNNLRLLVGRSLAQELYFDEALQRLDGLQPADVLDPASLLFYRSVAHHRLVDKEKGLVAVDKLLENKDEIPRRYAVLARLMRADLSQIKDGSLDDISRRMKDVERRLQLGRANKRVRDIEDKVVEMLDKLIKELEDQQSQSAGAGGGAAPSSPMQDSRIAELKAPGKVVSRDVGKSARWGELPPKEREETMQEIGRDFPAHYREVIEGYFRELAKQNK